MKKHNGFTIVELLIVIVIIGVLAALSIVAYNGIRKKAQTAQLQSDIRNIKQALTVYKAEHGKWPLCTAENVGSDTYSQCHFDNITPRLSEQNIPTRSANGTRLNYVVANNVGAWAILTVGPDGRCKAGENMYTTWYENSPECP